MKLLSDAKVYSDTKMTKIRALVLHMLYSKFKIKITSTRFTHHENDQMFVFMPSQTKFSQI